MTEKVREQILAIRDTGLTNMFDLFMVCQLAEEREYFEFLDYIEDHHHEYIRFIITGKTE